MAKGVQLNANQKEEIRRLTQLANRRIKAAERAYSKKGMSVVPREIVGDYQIKEQWNTKATPLSRSVRFDDEKAYRQHLKFLKSFERERPGIKEYTNVQRQKTLAAVETSLGQDAPKALIDKVKKMSAPELSQFWNKFSDKSAKLGMKYSSAGAMQQTMDEFFPEDMLPLSNVTTTTKKKV